MVLLILKTIIFFNRDSEYAFALYRDEINAQEDCNADILIEQKDKDDNPHKRKFVENNEKYLGLMVVEIMKPSMVKSGTKNINLI